MRKAPTGGLSHVHQGTDRASPNSSAARSRTAAAGAAIAALLAIAPPATADHVCEDWRIYHWCGEHLASSAFPLVFEVSSANASATQLANLLRASLDETEAWNQAWYLARVAAGEGGDANVCGPSGRLMCLSGTTTPNAGFTGDGRNTIAYRANLTGTCGAGSGYIAVTCLLYQAETGPGRHRIVEADIFLDSAAATFRAPTFAELLVGETAWAYIGPAPDAICSPRWADLWSVLAHELGHAIGLEHIHSGYPTDLTDVLPLRQTMWDTYRLCSTFQRSLAEGDLAGLIRVAEATFADGA